MHPLVILSIAVAVIFLLIIRLKINAFVALVTSAILIGVLSPQISLGEVMSEVGGRFGDVVGRIGVVIAMAAVIGQCLMASGAADRVTRGFVALLGEKHASLSLVISGYVLAVPVFSDTVFYLLIPLARAMSVRMGGKKFVLYALAIGAGGSATHVFVPPTPGPLAMAATLNLDLGAVILVGLLVAAPASFCGWLYSVHIDRKLNLPLREAPGLSLAELEKIAVRDDSELPPFWISMTPIILPVVLIASNTLAHSLSPGGPLTALTQFLGNPSFALLLSAGVSVWILARRKGLALAALAEPIEQAISSAGVIILITAGGGAFGGMLMLAGVGDAIGALSIDWGVPMLLLGFLLAVLFKIAQGSGTVCMITSAAILAPMIENAALAYHPVYVLMAVGSGALVGVWMNDSGFWIYRTMTGLTEVESLKTKTACLAAMGLGGFAMTLFLSAVMPLR